MHSRMFDTSDYRRSYVLYDDVICNIPRWGSARDYGAWQVARGVLVECSRALRGTPVSLRYRELLTRSPGDDPSSPAHLPVGIDITAVVRHSEGQLITIGYRRESGDYSLRGDFWQLTVNGVVPADGEHTLPPSLPWMASLVRRHVHDQNLR